MIKANTMTAAEEKALLKGWFETVQFDVDYKTIPPMQDEDDDEESRSIQLTEWLQNGASGPVPENIDDSLWSTLNVAEIGMSQLTARAIYQQEIEFQQLFGRANPYHDEKGKFAKGSSGGGGIATSTKTNLSDTQAESLRQRLRTPDGGFTVDVRTGKDVTTGFAVAIHEDRSVDIPAKDIKGSHLQSFVDKNQDLFADERNKFGAWHDPDTGQVWLDVSTVTSDRGEAIELGKQHNQISIFHLDNFEVINTGGTGRSWLAWRNEQRVFGGGAAPKVMARFNPNHDKIGKFASHKGGGGGHAPSADEAKVAIKGGKEIARGADRAVYHREGDYFAFKRATSRDGIVSNDREMKAYAEVKELGTGHKNVKVPEMVRVDEKIVATQFIDGVPLSTLPTPEYNKLDSSAVRAAKSLTNGDWHDDQVILDNKGNLWVVDLSGLGPEDRFNPNHDKVGKFASHKGFGNFEKSEATVVWGGSYVKARVWSAGQHSIIVTDSKFPDAMVEQRVIPTLNKLQSSNPLPAGKLLNVSIEPSLFHKGHAVHALTEVGSGNIKLNGKDLGPTIGDLNINEGVDVGFFPPAARNRGVDAVIAHEWGHSITTSPDEAQTMFANLPMRPSKYADTDGFEAYAENFSEFFLSNGTTTSSSAQQYAKEFEWKA